MDRRYNYQGITDVAGTRLTVTPWGEHAIRFEHLRSSHGAGTCYSKQEVWDNDGYLQYLRSR